MNNRQEIILREYIRSELKRNHRLDEGILSDAVEKAINSILPKIESAINKLKQFESASKVITDIIEDTGGAESVAKVVAVGNDFELSAKSVDNTLPSAKKESKAYLMYRDYQVRQTLHENRLINRRPINEVVAMTVLVAAFNAAGIIFGVIGAIPLMLKLVAKILKFAGFKKQSDAILSGPYEKAHHLEEKFIDFMLPDKIVYALYKKINPVIGKEKLMSLEEFVKSDLKKKYEKRIWVIILIPWLINGLTHIHHTFHSAFNVAETGATAVKATEVSVAAAEIAKDAAAIASAVTKAA